MTEQSLRVVVDTNVLLSFLMSRHSKPALCVTHVLKQHHLLISDATLQELAEKCSRAKFRPYFSEIEGQELIHLLKQVAEIVVVNVVITDCRDVKDNKFLELTVAGLADLLITGDKDLLILHPYRNIPVLSPHDAILWLGIQSG
ncbi:MAG: hypothetical protein RI964_2527 [Pseudomonadota bacterium]